jgi:hypothetical protein
MLRSNDSRHEPRVSLWSFPKAVFAWPLAASGLVVIGADMLGANGPWAGWLQLACALLVLLALAFDADAAGSAVLILLAAVLGFFALWLRLATDVDLFHSTWTALKNLVPSASTEVAFLSLSTGGFLVLYAVLRAVYDGRWQVTPNEFQRKVTFRRHESHARGAKTVQAEFPDLLEWMLGFGAGTLTVRDPRTRRVIDRVPHVFFLTSRINRIERLLELREVLHADDGSDDDSLEDDSI